MSVPFIRRVWPGSCLRLRPTSPSGAYEDRASTTVYRAESMRLKRRQGRWWNRGRAPGADRPSPPRPLSWQCREEDHGVQRGESRPRRRREGDGGGDAPERDDVQRLAGGVEILLSQYDPDTRGVILVFE